jgi:hypothetical protein
MYKPTLFATLLGVFSFGLISSASAQTYCTAVGPSSLFDTEIRDVFLQGDNYGISNPTTCPAVAGLRDYTQIDSADLSLGTSYTLEALMGTCQGNYTSFAKAWIDWNKDGDFTDAGEELGTWGSAMTAPLASTQRNATFSFTVPTGATLGRSRLRVMLRESGSATTTTPCAAFTYGAVHDYTIRITNTPPACPIPGTLSITGVASTQATVNWASLGTNFDVQYGAPGFTLGSGTTVTSTTTSKQLTGLTPNTSYDVYVRRNCGAAGTSGWAGPIVFSTTCATLALPTTETFTTFPPNCWTHNTGTANWLGYTTGGVTYAEADFWSKNQYSYILQSAPIALTTAARAVIDWSHQYMSSYPNDSLTLRVRDINSSTWTNVVTFKGTNFNTPGAGSTTPATAFTHTIAYLPSSLVGQTVIAQLYAWSDYGPDLFVDYITIEAQPACPEPLQLGATGITDVAATLNWQSGASSFAVQWGPAGFNIGTGSSDTVSTNSKTVTGLIPNYDYDFYVMTLCGTAGNSVWSGPYSFSTLCAGFTLLNGYSQNFDNLTVGDQPECWFVNGGATLEVATGTGTGAAYSTPNFAEFYAGSTTGAGVISPMFNDLANGTAQIRFRAKKAFTWSTVSLQVGILASPANPSSFVVVATVPLTDNWDEYTVPFPVVPTGFKHVAFRTTTTWVTVNLDNVVYEAQPACLPATQGAATAGATNAVVTWTHGGTNTPGATIAWGPAGFNPGTGVIPNVGNAAGTSYTITGLAPNTSYTAWIADSCGATTRAPWHGPINFTTSCLGVAMPYTENFDLTPLPCWTDGGTKQMMQYAMATGHAMRGNFWSWTDGNFATISSRPVTISAAAQATFEWSHQYMSFYPNDRLYLIGKTLTGTTWDTLVKLSGPSFNSPGAGTTTPGTFRDTTVNLPTSWVGSQAVFRFVANSGFGPDVFFDNLVVEAIPTCPKPLGTIVAGTVSTTSVGVNWTHVGSTPLGSNVKWGPAGFWTGTGTGTNGTTAWNVTKPYTITGLTAGATYDVYIRDSCSATDKSGWAGPYTVTTALCPPANQCTSVMYMKDSWGDGWNGGVISAQQKISGNWVNVKDFTFTTGSAATDSVRFCAGDSVRIMVTSAGAYPGEMGFDLVGPFGDTLSTLPYNSTLIAGSSINSFVAQCSPCGVPVGVNAAGSTTCTSTTVTWTAPSSATSSKLEYGVTGFTPGSGTLITGITGGTTNLTGLTPNTAYQVYVQSVCSSGTSLWSSPATVTTANAPQPTVTATYSVLSLNPVTIQFNATTANATSVSWTFSNGGSATGASTVQSFGTNGPASAVVTVTNDCGSASSTLNFTVGMGENALATLRVFPNPTSGLVRVEFPMATSGSAEVRVTSIAGTQLAVQRGVYNAGTQQVELDLRSLASGIYLLEVQTEDAVGVQRLVVER